jgi:hypothetical protein
MPHLGDVLEGRHGPAQLALHPGDGRARDADRHHGPLGTGDHALGALEADSLDERPGNHALAGAIREPVAHLPADQRFDRPPEDLRGRRVARGDPTLGIEHQHRAVHVLDDVLVVALQVADAPLGGAALANRPPAPNLLQRDDRQGLVLAAAGRHAIRCTATEPLERDLVAHPLADDHQRRPVGAQGVEEPLAGVGQRQVDDDQIDLPGEAAGDAGVDVVQHLQARLGAQPLQRRNGSPGRGGRLDDDDANLGPSPHLSPSFSCGRASPHSPGTGERIGEAIFRGGPRIYRIARPEPPPRPPSWMPCRESFR